MGNEVGKERMPEGFAESVIKSVAQEAKTEIQREELLKKVNELQEQIKLSHARHDELQNELRKEKGSAPTDHNGTTSEAKTESAPASGSQSMEKNLTQGQGPYSVGFQPSTHGPMPHPMMGSQPGGQTSQFMMAPPQVPPAQMALGAQPGGMSAHAMMGPQQAGLAYGQSVGSVNHPMMGYRPGQPTMGHQQLAQNQHAMTGPHPGPVQFNMPHNGPMSPHQTFVPQAGGMPGFGPNQGPMNHPDWDPQFPPQIGPMGPQMHHHHGASARPYAPYQINNAPRHQPNNFHGPNPKPQENLPKQKNVRPNEGKATQKGQVQNNQQKPKGDGPNQKTAPNKKAVANQNPPQANPANEKSKQQPKAPGNQPQNNNNKKQNPPQVGKQNAEKQEKGKKKALFSKPGASENRIDEFLMSVKNAQSSGDKSLNFEDLAKFGLSNRELWDSNKLAALFNKDEAKSEQPKPKPPIQLNDLAQMFDSKKTENPVPEPKPSKSNVAPKNQKQQNTDVKKFSDEYLKTMLEKVDLLSKKKKNQPLGPVQNPPKNGAEATQSGKSSGAPLNLSELQALVDKAKASTKANPGDAAPAPSAAKASGEASREKDSVNLAEMQALLEKMSEVLKALPSSEPPNAKPKAAPPKQKETGAKKIKKRGKKKKAVKANNGEDSDDSSDSDDAASEESSSSSQAKKQPLGKKTEKPAGEFQPDLTAANLPPLTKSCPGKKLFLMKFIGQKIPTKQEALAMGIKPGQLDRKVKDVVMKSGKNIGFPDTIMDIIKFGEAHPNARAVFLSDMVTMTNWKGEDYSAE